MILYVSDNFSAILDQMAEAAVSPADDDDNEGEARKARVPETRDRLKAKGTDLERGLLKIRRVSKK
jgi:hypothetical protein